MRLQKRLAKERKKDGMVNPKGCGKRLSEGNWWSYCGQTDMGQTAPALCVKCDPLNGYPLMPAFTPTDKPSDKYDTGLPENCNS